MCVLSVALWEIVPRFFQFLIFLNEQMERDGKITTMIKIDLEPQSSVQMASIHSVNAAIIFQLGVLYQLSAHDFKFMTIEMLKAQGLNGLMSYLAKL